MRKYLLPVLGVITLVVALVPHSVEASKPVPVIVAKQSFLNQTTALGTTTLFTPSADADYRLSLYLSGQDSTCNVGGDRVRPQVTLHWTDAQKAESLAFSIDVGNHCAWDAATWPIFHVASGNAITISTTVPNADAGNYYFTLEEL